MQTLIFVLDFLFSFVLPLALFILIIVELLTRLSVLRVVAGCTTITCVCVTFVVLLSCGDTGVKIRECIETRWLLTVAEV